MPSLPQICETTGYKANRLSKKIVKDSFPDFLIVLFAFPLDLQISLLVLDGIVDFLQQK